MTNLIIDLSDALDEYHDDDSVVVWAPHHREGSRGQVVNTAQKRIRLTGGKAEQEVEPGPLMIRIQCRGISDTAPKGTVVPDQDSVTLPELLEQQFIYDPPVVSAAQRARNEAEVFAERAESGADRVGSAEQVGEWADESRVARGEAVSAAQTAVTSADNASTSEKNAKASETNADDSASSASSSAAAASTAAGAAAASEESANSSATSASEAATAAEGAAVSAATSEQNASISEQNAAAAEERAGQSAETASNVSTEVQGVVNDAAAAILTDVEGSLDPVYVRQDDRTVHVKQFGAVGDGVADDTAAIESAIRSDSPIYWGGPNDKYRITETVIRYRTDTGPIIWASDGASIICDPESPIRRTVLVQTSGERISITGPLTIDANRMSFAGFSLDNTSQTDMDDAFISGLTVKNVHRSSNVHVGGDGVLIRGGFSRLVLDHLTIRGVTMADGVYGANGDTEAGIAGLSVLAFSPDRAPRHVHISALVVDGVYDEDTSHHNAQNGVRLYGASAVEGRPMPFRQTFNIVGGTIRNCGGRSVKVQRQWGSISGLSVYRDIPRAVGKAEIDFQRSGGRVTDLYVQYEGASSAEVLKFGAPPSDAEVVPHGSVDGLRLMVSGEQTPDAVITSNQYTVDDWRLTARDIEAIGAQPSYIIGVNGGSGGKSSAIVSDVYAAPERALIRATGGSDEGWKGTIAASNCVNTGGSEVPVFISDSGDGPQPVHRVSNISGFSVPDALVDRAVVTTVGAATAGWNNLNLVSGFGKVYSPSYYRPPAGVYRITYLRASNVPFDRKIGADDRTTVTLAGGVASEIVKFEAVDYLNIAGSMADLTVVLETLA